MSNDSFVPHYFRYEAPLFWYTTLAIFLIGIVLDLLAYFISPK